MKYKTILLCLTDAAQAERLITAGCTLARRFDAHLIGLHVLQSLEVYPGAAIDLPPPAASSFAEEKLRQAEEIQSAFERLTTKEDFVSEWRLVKAGSAYSEDRLVEHAHCADLIVMVQADRDDHGAEQSRALQEVIKRSGRPILVIPYVGDFLTFGVHALIGWSATRESSRAVHDAIPLLADGGKATVIWVSQGSESSAYLESTAHQVATCLDRHGIDGTVTHWENSQIGIADALLNEAFDRQADLIVTGAFGHSKFYDFVIGATTSALLDHMTLPVLFSK